MAIKYKKSNLFLNILTYIIGNFTFNFF